MQESIIMLGLVFELVGVFFAFAVEDETIFEHIVDPRIEFVQKVFSVSALGDETSTSGIR